MAVDDAPALAAKGASAPRILCSGIIVLDENGASPNRVR
jgi:hypothetical protein